MHCWTTFCILLLYCLISCVTGRGPVIQLQDGPYEVINIKVPREIWNQALSPTPVLRSPVTIVVPVHVPGEENNVDDDEELEEELINENEVVIPQTPGEQLVQDALNETQIVANVTQAPTLEDPTTLAPEVTGQVVRFPCSCPDGQCGCCTGTFMERFKMKTCGNISFIPEDFVFDVRLSVNNNTVIRRRVSASDPPPICFNPRRAPFVEVCAEISNIRIRDKNAYACLDINAHIGSFPVYEASFRCFGLGQSGVQSGLKPKPVSAGPKPVSIYGNSEDDDDRGGFLDTITGGLLGVGDGGEGGFFGGGGGGSDDDDGPFDGIGDAFEDLFDGRRKRKARP